MFFLFSLFQKPNGFLKLFSDLKNKENKENVFGFQFIFFLKSIKKNTKVKEQIRVFKEHIFGVLFVFKNCCQ